MRQVLVLLILAIAGTAQAGEAALTEASVRAFIDRQEAAWNAKDTRAFVATFAADAQFVAQGRDSHGGLTSNGKSTLAQATAQSRRFFAKNLFHETGFIDRIVIAPDGRAARVYGHVITRIEAPGRRPQNLCAETLQSVALAKGRLLSRGQTETDVRCPR